eukprot:Nk52_evm63s2039 gene=Nk52_evmTU63s2039
MGKANAQVLHCGVLDFSAEENTCIIPRWIMEQLGLKDAAYVSVKIAEDLPTAEFAALQVLDETFMEIEDAGACLESCVGPSYTAITADQTLVIYYQGRKFGFHVKELEPERACSLLDAELAVDVIPPLGASAAGRTSFRVGAHHLGTGRSDEEPVIPVNLVMNTNGNGDAETAQEASEDKKFMRLNLGSSLYTFSRIEIPAHALSYSGHLTLRIRVTSQSKVGGGDYEGYIGTGLIKTPSREMHMYRIGVDKMYDDVVEMDVKDCTSFYLSLRMYGSPSAVKGEGVCLVDVIADLIVSEDGNKKEGTTQLNKGDVSVGGENVENKVRCKNCTEWIPERTFALHSAYCERNNVLCEDCGMIVRVRDKASHWHCEECGRERQFNGTSEDKGKYLVFSTDPLFQAKHQEIMHSVYTCSLCPAAQFKGLLEINEHTQKVCPERKIECRYCRNVVKAGPVKSSFDNGLAISQFSLSELLGEHESYCGSRTSQCDVCREYVRMKDMEVHLKLHTFDSSRAQGNIDKGLQNERYESRNASAGSAMNIDFPVSPDINREIKFCRNKICCRELWDRSPQKLCKSCLKQTLGSGEVKGKQEFFQRLVKMYYEQLTMGCNKVNCTNTLHCVSAPGWDKEKDLGFNTVDLKHLAEHCIGRAKESFQEGEPSYTLCIDEDGEEFRRRIVHLESMGFSREKCFKALEITGLSDPRSDNDVTPAAVWLLNNS